MKWLMIAIIQAVLCVYSLIVRDMQSATLFAVFFVGSMIADKLNDMNDGNNRG